MSEAEIETARLLARFKLQVRRSLNMPVDLALLTDDAEYASGLFREVEERAEDEDLLTLLVQLRARLQDVAPAAAPLPAAVAPPEAVAPQPPSRQTKPMRDYRFGARG